MIIIRNGNENIDNKINDINNNDDIDNNLNLMKWYDKFRKIIIIKSK